MKSGEVIMDRKITIVDVKKEYIEKAGDIAIKAWTPIREEFRRILGDELYEPFFNNWQEPKRRSITSSLEKARGFIALVDGVVAGFIFYTKDEASKTAQIGGMAVDSDFKGLGLGKKLCNHALEQMRLDGMLYATVTTGLDDAHAPARHTYESVGFEKNLPSVKYYMNL